MALVPGFGAPALAVALAAACAGFLPFNFPRARIFLGDVGSGALGYLLAVLLATGFTSRGYADWPLLLLPLLAMLADSGFTLLGRIHRGERWWDAHTAHAYQCWSRHGGHARVTLAYGLWTLAAIGVMLPTLGSPGNEGVLLFLAGLLAAFIAWRWLQRPIARQTEGFGS